MFWYCFIKYNLQINYVKYCIVFCCFSLSTARPIDPKWMIQFVSAITIEQFIKHYCKIPNHAWNQVLTVLTFNQ
jgi:hypothetical protein